MNESKASESPAVGDCIVVAFIDSVDRGYTFARHRNEWPLHVTLLPWFTVDKQQLSQQLKQLSEHTETIRAHIGSELLFGEAADIPVNIIERQEALVELHKALHEALVRSGGELRNDTWTGAAYRPHITRHNPFDGHYEAGDELIVTKINVVEILENKLCQVVAVYDLYESRHETAS